MEENIVGLPWEWKQMSWDSHTGFTLDSCDNIAMFDGAVHCQIASGNDNRKQIL